MTFNSTLVNTTLLTDGGCLLVDPYGNPYVDWIWKVMGECGHSGLELSSFWVGLASLVLYLFGGLPQIFTNFKNKQADGLSPFTLAQFMIGDGANLLGAILTSQLFTQVILAVYFVLVDVILISQYVGFKIWNKCKGRKKQSMVETECEKPDDQKPPRHDLELQHIEPSSSVQASAGVALEASPVHVESFLRAASSMEFEDEPSLGSEGKNHRVLVLHKRISSDLEMKQSLEVERESTMKRIASAIVGDMEETRVTKLYATAALIVVFAVIGIFVSLANTRVTHSKHISEQFQSTSVPIVGRKLLSLQSDRMALNATRDHNAVEFPPSQVKPIIGFVIGCISTLFYLGSRIAQIIRNFWKGSTEGMNPFLFLTSFVGNILYSLSIFLFSIDDSFLMSKIPWLTSSLGNMTLDSILLIQYFVYTHILKRRGNEKKESKSSDEKAIPANLQAPAFDNSLVQCSSDEENDHVTKSPLPMDTV